MIFPVSIRYSPYQLYSDNTFRAYLQLYLCAAILANFLSLFWDGHSGDIGFWQNWATQLNTRGYNNFNGNYPPLYIHWLYIVGQFYSLLQMPVENNLFLKYLAQLPVLVFHLFLITIIYQVLKRYSTQSWHFHSALCLTALNPAILLNGPVWGQIDVIPAVPVCLALLASSSQRYRWLTMPLYATGLLVKFQMIAFAPVFGIIFFRHIKLHLLGSAIALLVIVLAFLPSALSGHAFKAFQLAYLDVVQQYGRTTMGAANIWILLTGNAAPDNIVLFGIDPDSSLARLFKAKTFGIVLCFLVFLAVFLHGIVKQIKNKDISSPQTYLHEILFYALVCAVAFFTLLPAMHERYLMPAVIMSLLLYATNPKKVIYPILLTFISAFNLAMTLGIKTSHMWPVISWIMLAGFFYTLSELLLKERWLTFIHRKSWEIFDFRYLSVSLFIILLPLIGYKLYVENRIIEIPLQTNERWLSEWPVHFSRQDFGQLRLNKNIHGKTLSAGNRRYAKGIGTHARSTIEFDLSSRASTLSGKVGLDDGIESASVQFSIWGDGQELWKSQPHYGFEAAEAFSVDISNVQILRLYVDGLGEIRNDHANWLNMILTLEPEKNYQ